MYAIPGANLGQQMLAERAVGQAGQFFNPAMNAAKAAAGKVAGLAGSAPGAARIAGSVGLKGLGAATKFLGPIGLATTAVGGILNAGNRMMKGENPITAVGNAAYDTADFAAFGLLKPAVGMIQGAGEMAGKAVFGESPEDKINGLHRTIQEAEANGDYGTAAVASQKLQQEMQQLQAPTQQGMAQNQQDYSMGLQNQRFGNELQQQQQMFDQQYANSNRVKENEFNLQKRAANQALNNSYYSDAWKNTQAIGRDNVQALNQLSQTGMQNMGQAMMMRY